MYLGCDIIVISLVLYHKQPVTNVGLHVKLWAILPFPNYLVHQGIQIFISCHKKPNLKCSSTVIIEFFIDVPNDPFSIWWLLVLGSLKVKQPFKKPNRLDVMVGMNTGNPNLCLNSLLYYQLICFISKRKGKPMHLFLIDLFFWARGICQNSKF